MATTKITELTAATTIANTDILVVVTDPSGSPTTKKITANNLVNSLANATLRQLPYANSSSNGTIKVGTNLTINATGHLSVNSNISVNSITATSKLQVGNSAGFAFNNSLIEIDGSANTYLQSVIQNANSGTNASGDLVITADTGNDSVDYVDFGINSSNYSNAEYSLGGGGDGYIYASNGNFTVGVLGATKELKLHAGNASNESVKLTVNASSVYVNTSTTFKVGSNFTANSNSLTLGNSTVNTSITSNAITLGNTSTSIVTVANGTLILSSNSGLELNYKSSQGYIGLAASDNGIAYIKAGNSSASAEWLFHSNGAIAFPDTTTQNTAYTGLYTAANSSNWTNPAPTTIAAAIDRLAAVVKTLNGGTGA